MTKNSASRDQPSDNERPTVKFRRRPPRTTRVPPSLLIIAAVLLIFVILLLRWVSSRG